MNKGRLERREVSVYGAVGELAESWHGMSSVVMVERFRRLKGKESRETSYYISSLSPSVAASVFSAGIRGHWGVESMHYVKDVILREDASKLCKGESAVNMSLLRSVLFNIFRHHGSDSIAKGIRRIGHNMLKLSKILLEQDMSLRL